MLQFPEIQVTISDLSGKIVKKMKFRDEIKPELSLDELAPGTYFVRVVTDTSTAVVKVQKLAD
jgi:hypothetical protein